MALDLNKMIKEIHDNAVAHGFREDGRNLALTRALIHSEWSEALEEYRSGRPMFWRKCRAPQEIKSCCRYGGNCQEMKGCKFGGDYIYPKPEGIAVELLDGVIRILDLMGAYGDHYEYSDGIPNIILKRDLPEIIDMLHSITADFANPKSMCRAIALTTRWLEAHGVDWEKMLLMKHEYNKSRPYLHGKKC